MKISKTHLRQVIKEELESYFPKPQNLNESNESNESKFSRFLDAIIAGEVDLDLRESEEHLEEISNNPGSPIGVPRPGRTEEMTDEERRDFHRDLDRRREEMADEFEDDDANPFAYEEYEDSRRESDYRDSLEEIIAEVVSELMN